MKQIGVPEGHYANVGKIVVAASKLEVMGASILSGAKGDDMIPGREDWMEIAGRAGRVRRELLALLSSLPNDEELRQFVTDYEAMQEERHKVVHSIVELVFPVSESTGGPGVTVREGDPMRWALINPRDGSESELPSDEDVADLVVRINALSARAIRIGNRLYAEA